MKTNKLRRDLVEAAGYFYTLSFDTYLANLVTYLNTDSLRTWSRFDKGIKTDIADYHGNGDVLVSVLAKRVRDAIEALDIPIRIESQANDEWYATYTFSDLRDGNE